MLCKHGLICISVLKFDLRNLIYAKHAKTRMFSQFSACSAYSRINTVPQNTFALLSNRTEIFTTPVKTADRRQCLLHRRTSNRTGTPTPVVFANLLLVTWNQTGYYWPKIHWTYWIRINADKFINRPSPWWRPPVYKMDTVFGESKLA